MNEKLKQLLDSIYATEENRVLTSFEDGIKTILNVIEDKDIDTLDELLSDFE